MTNPKVKTYMLCVQGACHVGPNGNEYADYEAPLVSLKDYEVLRGNLSLAEEGLANYALEVERKNSLIDLQDEAQTSLHAENVKLRDCWSEALANVTTRNQEIQRLTKERDQARLTAAARDGAQRFHAALEFIQHEQIPQGMSPALFAAKVLEGSSDEPLLGASFPRLEFAEHCWCCVRNKITLEVFGPTAESAPRGAGSEPLPVANAHCNGCGLDYIATQSHVCPATNWNIASNSKKNQVAADVGLIRHSSFDRDLPCWHELPQAWKVRLSKRTSE